MKMKLLAGAFLALSICTVTETAFGRAGKETGGGDLCENRIKSIAHDFKSWIQAGGPNGLSLPQTVTAEVYSTSMLEALAEAKVACVSVRDKDYPVEVFGMPKTCKFERENDQSLIICDTQKFASISESDQYVLTHHEYAGIAGIETPAKGDSDYSISNQISGYLEDTITKKLVVRPVPTAISSTLEGSYALDFYASTNGCGAGFTIEIQPTEFVVRFDATSWGEHYRLGSFCRDRSTSDVPPRDPKTCSTYVETNSLSPSQQSFERHMTKPFAGGSAGQRVSDSKLSFKLITNDRLQREQLSFDRDGKVVQPTPRCFYDRLIN